MRWGGIINVAVNWDKIGGNFWKGLGYFASGGLQGGLSTLGPVGVIAGGFLSSAANTALDGGSIGDMFTNGLIGAVSGFVGGKVGKLFGKFGNVALNGIKNVGPAIKGFIGGAFGGYAGGYASGFVGGLFATGSLKQAHQAGLAGGKMGGAIGSVSGGISAYKWAKENKVDPWNGQKINGHHSFPKFMEGDPDQPLTNIGEDIHKQLHKDMNNFLRNQTDEFGNHMRPQRGNPGYKIRQRFDFQIRVDALKQFYNQNWYKYPRSTFDFYRNSNQLNLQWKIFKK